MLVGLAVVILLAWGLVRAVLRRARACLVAALVAAIVLGLIIVAAMYMGWFGWEL